MPQKQGSRVQTMPEYGGTLLVVIASHGAPTCKKWGLGGSLLDAKLRLRGLCLEVGLIGANFA